MKTRALAVGALSIAALVLASLNFFRESAIVPGQNISKLKLPETVILNEVMTGNYRLHYDKNGMTSDWIEIKNVSGVDIQMKGYGLSDAPEKPFKFRFPAIVVPADGNLVVRARAFSAGAAAVRAFFQGIFFR